MPTVLTKTLLQFSRVARFITIHLLADLHRVNTLFLPLLKMTEVSRNVDIIFYTFFCTFFYTCFNKFFTKFLPPCCWHLRLQYWSFWSFLLILPSFYIFTMDFLTIKFGQLLHLLDNELKKFNIIRNFEKQKKQIISAEYGILFNQTWIYIYIY